MRAIGVSKNAGSEAVMEKSDTAQVPVADASRSRAAAKDTIRRIADGDHLALGELYDCYSSLVMRVCTRILRDVTDAEEVLQTVFVQAWRQAAGYDSTRGTPEAWLCTIARTRALDQLRRRTTLRQKSFSLPPPHERTPPTVEGLAVRRALGALPHSQRQALELAYFEGFTQSEIAARLRAPLGTVKTRMRGAMKRMRAALSPLSPSTALPRAWPCPDDVLGPAVRARPD
jgi:RNA polymerase sigma-70 factor (ECF subfamily)